MVVKNRPWPTLMADDPDSQLLRARQKLRKIHMVGQGKHKGFLVLLVARKKRAWVNEQRTAPVVMQMVNNNF